MGTLYIVATPIGNLKDITFRAVETLKAVDLILCEDTRVTGKLLVHYGITNHMRSFNDFNEESKVTKIIDELILGKNIALVSSAGTPLISDPGFKLVRGAIKNNVKVEAIPGPSAVQTALVVSGLPTDKFLFVGYLPKKDSKRTSMLSAFKSILGILKFSLIIYESPHRLFKTLEAIKEVFGDIDVVICRELTKIHEEIRREQVSDSINYFSTIKPKGEFTIVI